MRYYADASNAKARSERWRRLGAALQKADAENQTHTISCTTFGNEITCSDF